MFTKGTGAEPLSAVRESAAIIAVVIARSSVGAVNGVEQTEGAANKVAEDTVETVGV